MFSEFSEFALLRLTALMIIKGGLFYSQISYFSFSRLCLLLKVSMREEILGEWLLSGLWSCCGLYTTGVAALCCIIKSHIHALSFSFFLPVSLYQWRSQTGTSMNRGQRWEKVEVFVCPRDSLSHWLAFSHSQAGKRKRKRKK